MKIQKRSISKKVLVLTAAGIIVLASLGAGAYALYRQTSQANTSARPVNSVDYSPPTDREKAETEAFKQSQESEENTTPESNVDGKKVVTPVISYIGQYDASVESSAYIPEIIENDGTCTLILESKSSMTITKVGKAVADAQNTRCELFTFAAKELKPGIWSGRIDYSSPVATGSSTKMEFKVQ